MSAYRGAIRPTHNIFWEIPIIRTHLYATSVLRKRRGYSHFDCSLAATIFLLLRKVDMKPVLFHVHNFVANFIAEAYLLNV